MSTNSNVSPADFAEISEQIDPMKEELAGQIATRLAAGDMSSFFGLLPNPDPVLRAMGRSIQVYRSLLADPSVMGARRRRMSAVLAMSRGLHPDLNRNTPDKVIQACDDMLARLDMQRILRELMDGAFFGYRVSEVMWGANTSLGAHPIDLVAKPNQWFGFGPQNSELRFLTSNDRFMGTAVPDRKFVVVGRNRSWDNPYGEPDLAACFWPVIFKRAGIKFWITFTEKYGMPWAVGKLPRQASQSETDDLAEKLAAMVRDAVAVIPNDASVDLMTVSSSFNADLYEQLLKFCRSEISIALLGNNQSVEAEANLSSAQAARQVEKYLRDDDAQMVGNGLNQLMAMYCEVNFPGQVPPVFSFWDKGTSTIKMAERDLTLSKAGVNFRKSYWQRTYNLQEGDIAQQ